MLVIFTRSDDGTANALEQHLQSPFMRVNLDSEDQWAFQYLDGKWRVQSREITHLIGADSRAWWWKGFLDSEDGDNFRNSEVTYLCREIYAEISRRGTRLGNSPWFHNSRGKLHALDVARKHFEVPVTSSTFNSQLPSIGESVVKSLSSEPFTSGRVLYTTKVELETLDPFGHVWLAQEFINATHDVSVTLVGKSLFVHSRSRDPQGTVDWRAEQFDIRNDRFWTPHELTPGEIESVQRFRDELGVSWGRLDLLTTIEGSLVFLEFNANGQFGFLDPTNSGRILETVASYLESYS